MAITWYYTADQVTLEVMPLPDAVLEGENMVPTEPLIEREDWDRLAATGWYQEYREPSILYQDGWEPAVVGVEPSEGYPVAYVAAGPKLPDSDIRNLKQSDINAQVENPSTQDLVRDPRTQQDLQRELAAASDKTVELQNTADADVEDFDPTLDVAAPQESGVEYCNFAVSIGEVDPWAGAPDNNLGFIAELEVLTDDPSQGDEARLIVVEAPSDVGAVLPFVQDSTNPALWMCQARDGHKWSDPGASASVQLLWGAGSLPTSPVLLCEQIYDRQAILVRYGTA